MFDVAPLFFGQMVVYVMPTRHQLECSNKCRAQVIHFEVGCCISIQICSHVYGDVKLVCLVLKMMF